MEIPDLYLDLVKSTVEKASGSKEGKKGDIFYNYSMLIVFCLGC